MNLIRPEGILYIYIYMRGCKSFPPHPPSHFRLLALYLCDYNHFACREMICWLTLLHSSHSETTVRTCCWQAIQNRDRHVIRRCASCTLYQHVAHTADPLPRTSNSLGIRYRMTMTRRYTRQNMVRFVTFWFHQSFLRALPLSSIDNTLTNCFSWFLVFTPFTKSN